MEGNHEEALAVLKVRQRASGGGSLRNFNRSEPQSEPWLSPRRGGRPCYRIATTSVVRWGWSAEGLGLAGNDGSDEHSLGDCFAHRDQILSMSLALSLSPSFRAKWMVNSQ